MSGEKNPYNLTLICTDDVQEAIDLRERIQNLVWDIYVDTLIGGESMMGEFEMAMRRLAGDYRNFFYGEAFAPFCETYCRFGQNRVKPIHKVTDEYIKEIEREGRQYYEPLGQNTIISFAKHRWRRSRQT